MFYEGKTAAEVLDATEGIEDITARLFVLRKWVSSQALRSEAIVVSEVAIQDAITNSEFSPNATFYREVATPLPFVEDLGSRAAVMSLLDGQKPLIRRQGPTIDFVRLQLCLARCECLMGELSRAANRLEEAYLDSVEETSELETRISCLAWFWGEMSTFDADGELSVYTETRELVEAEFEKALDRILGDGAEQFGALLGALQALAVHQPRKAYEICGRLNTIDRRDAALLHVLRTMCESDLAGFAEDVVCDAIDNIGIGPELDRGMEAAAGRIETEVAGGQSPANSWRALLARVSRCQSAAARVNILSKAMVSSAGADPELAEAIGSQLLEAFGQIGSPSEKYDVACDLVAALRPSFPELAASVFEHLKAAERPTRYSDGIARGIHLVMDILSKAAFALVRRKDLAARDVSRVCQLISSVDEPIGRIDLFSTLSFYLWREGEDARFSEVMEHWVWPALESLSEADDDSVTHVAWLVAYAVAWLSDSERANLAVRNFPSLLRTECHFVLALSLLNRQPLGEPFDDAGVGRPQCSYSDFRDLLDLCEVTDSDLLIHLIFERMAKEVTGKRQRTEITRNQKAEMSRRMFDIAERRLPLPERISHSGYKILCRAQALRIGKHPTLSWSGLAREAESIPNAADRAFVLARLAACLPGRERRRADALLDAAEAEAGGLQTFVDQYDRFYAIADLASGRSGGRASRAVKGALTALRRSPSAEKGHYERRIVDLAYRIDAELPVQLATLYDDDPARDDYRERARRQVERHQLKRDLGDARAVVDLAEERESSDLAWACWRALGSLNSGRMAAVDIAVSREMMAYASQFPIEDSFSMYSWAIANVMERYSLTQQGETYARDIFEGTLRAAELFLSIAGQGSGVVTMPDWRDGSHAMMHLVVREGDRGRACEFIRKWLAEHGEEQVTVVDPYFGAEDLWVLLEILEIGANLTVRVLTGTGDHEEEQGGTRGAYLAAWGDLYESNPPETEVTVVRTRKTKKPPFHDRYMLSKAAGLRLGTSLNSLGRRDSELSIIGAEEVRAIERDLVEPYQSRRRREFEGQRLEYQSFEL